MDLNELLNNGYNPGVFYEGYDENWILGRGGPSSKWPTSSSQDKKEKEKHIELYMSLCCDGCVEKVYKKLKQIEGVASVHCDKEKHKVTVRGPAKPEAVLKEAKRIGQSAVFWKDKK